jgi:hypothetical protein
MRLGMLLGQTGVLAVAAVVDQASVNNILTSTCRHAAGHVAGADWRVGCSRCCRPG